MFFENCEIIMYGVGELGEKFWYENHKKTSLKLCIDRSEIKQKKGFHGYKVISPDTLSLEVIGNAKIVVTTRFYNEIKQFLISKNLEEFKDFIPFGLFRKELVVIFGNCYKYYITQALQQQKEFSKKYYIYEIEAIYERNGRNIDDNLLKKAKIFMCQDIQDTNKYSKYLSFDFLKTKVSSECNVICYPNLVGFGKFLFPQLTKKEELEYDADKIVSLMRRDSVLDYCIEKKWSIDQTLEYVKNYSFDNIDLLLMKKKAVNIFLKREQKWNIKIMKYIIDNFSTKKMMIDEYHPSIDVMEEIVKRIMEYLGLKYYNNCSKIRWQIDYFIYPQVRELLHLCFQDIYIRDPEECYYWFTNKRIDFEEYVKEYLFYYG